MNRRAVIFWAMLVVGLALCAFHRPGDAANTNLAYDEIVKFAITASPPPPGNFSADYAAIVNPQQTTAQAPAPKKRGLFGSIDVRSMVHAVADGGSVGSVAQSAANGQMEGAKNNALDTAMDGIAASFKPLANSLSQFANGRVERHAFYGSWERVDDVAAQTATIEKCDLHQRITLDLKNKTYHIDDPSAPSSHGTTTTTAAAPSRGCTSAPREPEAPGTGTLSLTSTSTNLAPMTIDGVATTGVHATNTVAIEHATGSCKNGSFSMATTTYYSPYPVPHAYCPLPKAYVHPESAQSMATSSGNGGCKLTPAMHVTTAAAPRGSDRLALYELMAMGGSAGSQAAAPGAGMSFVIERGNVHSLGASDASLFDVPAGFTKV